MIDASKTQREDPPMNILCLYIFQDKLSFKNKRNIQEIFCFLLAQGENMIRIILKFLNPIVEVAAHVPWAVRYVGLSTYAILE